MDNRYCHSTVMAVHNQDPEPPPPPSPHDSEKMRRMRGRFGETLDGETRTTSPDPHTIFPSSHRPSSRETLRRQVGGRAGFPSFHGAPKAELCALKIGSHMNRRAGGRFGRLSVPPPPEGYRATLNGPELPSPDMEF